MESDNGMELNLSRTFDVRRELVYKAWTDAWLLAKWWGPDGFTNHVYRFEAFEGGAIEIDMHDPKGNLYRTSGSVLAIIESEKLIFTIAPFKDEAGNARVVTLITVSFSGSHEAEVTVHVEIIKDAASARNSIESMEEGWNQRLDRLTDVLLGSANSNKLLMI